MDPPSNPVSSDNDIASLIQLATAAVAVLVSSTSASAVTTFPSTTVSATAVSDSQGSTGRVTVEVGGQTFTLFPRLVAELRNMIWKESFEGRATIALGHECYRSATCYDAEKAWKRENSTPLPAAFYASKESRTEALRHYDLIYRSKVNAPVKFNGLRPICASSGDLFWLEFITLMHSPGELHDWLSAVKVSYPSFLDKVTTLEVRGTFTQAFFVNIFAVNKRTSLLAQDFRKMYCASFLLFPALKEITFTGKRGDQDWNNPAGMLLLTALESWITAFLNNAKTAFKSQEAPTVSFRSFKTFEESLDE
ncbi:hypothetical protein IFR05_006138 [Cadophora sp. M221]|nr:hypothetical protein IFR05_006138 [Cadophora sp. M221]